MGELSAASDLRVFRCSRCILSSSQQAFNGWERTTRRDFRCTGVEWAIRKKKEGQIKSLPHWKLGHEGLLRRFTQERLLQFSPKHRFRLLAAIFLLALEDLAGRRKLFSHPRQPWRNSFDFHLRRGAQWSVLSSKPSLSTTVPPWRNIISSPSESILMRSPSLNSPSRILTAKGS